MDQLSPATTFKLISEAISSSIQVVLDVGVQGGTPCLMSSFPKAHHYLFEPVDQYHPTIEQKYAQQGIQYTLEKVAVSNASGIFFQHKITDGNESRIVTHSQLLEQRNPAKFGDRLHSISEVEVIALDDWMKATKITVPYLLKIDVDGLEDLIIEGAKDTIRNASALMVESGLSTLSSRVSVIEEMGMVLFDIVGQGYYFNQLQLVDLIFVSPSLIENNIKLRPWEMTKGRIDWDQWKQHT